MIFLWWVLFVLLGFIGFPLLFIICPRFRDRGYGLAKAFGLVAVAYPVWLGAFFGIPFSKLSIILSIILIGLCSGAVFWFNRDKIIPFFKQQWKILIWVEIVFIVAMLFMAQVRMRNPEIESRWLGYASEKLMDMNFLNSVLSSREFPPEDNWLEGHPINYYYYGYYLTAFMTRLSGVEPEFGYNLMLIFLFALAFTGFFSIGSNITGRKLCGIIAAAVALVMSNLKGFYIFWERKETVLPPSDIWAASRVIELQTDKTINEFPWFSFIWGDLHGHLAGLPFGVLLLGILANVQWLRTGKDENSTKPITFNEVWGAFAIALVLGSLVAINSWDLPTYSLLVVGGVLIYLGPARVLSWIRAIGFRVAAVAVGIGLFWPFFHHFVAPTTGINREITQKTPIKLMLFIFGIHFFLSFSYVIFRTSQLALCNRRHRLSLIIVLAVAIVLLIAGTILTGHWVVGPLAFLLAMVFYIYISCCRDLSPTTDKDVSALWRPKQFERFALLLIGMSLCIIIGCEFVAMNDFYGQNSARMNTLFKFHFQAWLFLSIASAWAIGVFLDLKPKRIFPLIAKYLWLLIALLFICAGLTFTYKAIEAKTDRWSKEPTLDGLAYMQKSNPGDYGAIKFLREATQDMEEKPIILEAPGGAYTQHSRIATFTGLPTLIGWANHEGIWHRRQPEVGAKATRRTGLVNRIYRSMNFGETKRLLEENNIEYVVIGKYEKDEYEQEELAKFPKYMQTVYDQDGTIVLSGYKEPERTEYPDEVLPIDKRKPPVPLKSEAVWGSQGTGEGQFAAARGVAVAEDGSVYVIDRDANRVQKFDNEGTLQTTWGKEGDGPGQFKNPHGIAVSDDGDVYVADTWNHRIQKFDSDGNFLLSFTGDFWGPRDLDVDANGNVYVSDTGQKMVKVFDGKGGLITQWGSGGKERGQFNEPVGISVQRDRVFVADTGNRRIQVFNKAGQVLHVWQVVSGWREFFTEPYLTTDNSGNLIVSDSRMNRLQHYNQDGEFINFYGPLGSAPGHFNGPMGVEIGPDGYLYVTDVNNSRVQKLVLPE